MSNKNLTIDLKARKDKDGMIFYVGKIKAPVLIDCSPTTLTKREKWYNIPRRRFHLRIEVLAPFSTRPWIDADTAPPIAARQLTQALETFFTQELERDGRSLHTQRT